jgi:hypothetical protein
MQEIRSTLKIFVGKPEGKGPFGRHVRKRDDKNEDDLKRRVGKCGLDSYGSE